MTDRRAIGEAKARAALKRTQASERQTAGETLPWNAVVTGVAGDQVTVRATNAASGSAQPIPYVAASIDIGDVGVCIPLAGGGVVFAKTGLPGTSPCTCPNIARTSCSFSTCGGVRVQQSSGSS